MLTIAIVAEGPTDHVILENILYGFSNDPDLNFTPLHPAVNNYGNKIVFENGGFDRLIKFLGTQRFKEGLPLSDLVIIQIDTDVCEQFGVSKFDQNGEAIEGDKILEAIKIKLIENIGSDFYQEWEHKIVFAISEEMIECWLLTLFYKGVNESKESSSNENCIKLINQKLKAKKPKRFIDPNNKQKEIYDIISYDFSSHSKFKRLVNFNNSFKYFLDSLSTKYNNLITSKSNNY
jgi:hypothetical protein